MKIDPQNKLNLVDKIILLMILLPDIIKAKFLRVISFILRKVCNFLPK